MFQNPRMIRTQLLFSALVLSLTGCGIGAGLTSGDLTCIFQAVDGEKLACMEAKNTDFQTSALIRAACSAGGHTLTSGSCDRTNVIAGCQGVSTSEGQATEWYYVSSKTKTMADCDKACNPANKLIDVSGKELKRGTNVCSMKTGTSPVSVNFRNKTGVQVELFLREESTCNEISKATIDTALPALSTQVTNAGMVWVVREAKGGALRLEHTVTGFATIDVP